MTEKGILFSGQMVRAILDGRKTATRRLVKPMAGHQRTWLDVGGITASPSLTFARVDGALGVQMEHPKGGPLGWVRCPYREGDKLWVRETWRAEERASDNCDGVRYAADDAFVEIKNTRAAADAWVEAYDNGRHEGKWRPSIYMPRWASRVLLTITSVRVERLGDITEDDAIAEGVTPLGISPEQPIFDSPHRGRTFGTHPHVGAYACLWDELNDQRAPWSSNPWVYVIGFERTKEGTGS